MSSIISDLADDYPNFAWWTLVYMLFCIILVFITVATDTVFTYHVAITGFMAAGLVFTTSSVNSLIYYSEAPKEAGAAGFILLSMVAVSTTLTKTYGALSDLFADRVDLLLRLPAAGIAPPDPRLVCSPQRGPRAESNSLPPYDAVLPPRDHTLAATPADV